MVPSIANTQPATRDVFPFGDDLDVLKGYLAGVHHRVSRIDPRMRWMLQPRVNDLFYGESVVLSTSPTDGALFGLMLQGPHYGPGVRLIHMVGALMGFAHKQITREERWIEGASHPDLDRLEMSHRELLYFYDGEPVVAHQPFLLCGPVGMLAYRAARPTPQVA